MAKITISIPKPCNENWNEMTNSGCGKHCKVCDKIVVDFTSMTTNEMHNYFLNHSQQKICGRFKATQIRNQYTPLQESLIKIYNRIEAKPKRNFINIVCFFFVSCAIMLSGCTGTIGEVDIPEETLIGDTIYNVQSVDTTTNGLDNIKTDTIKNFSKMKSPNNK